MLRPGRSLCLAAGLVTCLLATTACAPHQIRGKVIAGEATGIEIVREDDPRLQRGGVSDVLIELVIDPASMQPQRLSEQRTGTGGFFQLALDPNLAAGFLNYDLGIYCRANGFNDLYETQPVPRGKRLLLITMSPGVRRVPRETDVLQDTLEMGNRLLEEADR